MQNNEGMTNGLKLSFNKVNDTIFFFIEVINFFLKSIKIVTNHDIRYKKA